MVVKNNLLSLYRQKINIMKTIVTIFAIAAVILLVFTLVKLFKNILKGELNGARHSIER